MSQYQLVLDDNLLSFFYKIRSGNITVNNLDDKKLASFFKFYRPHLTNIRQIERLESNNMIDSQTASRIKPILAKQQGQLDLTLDVLLKHTSLKIVLTEDEKLSEPYYVNINKTIFDSHYVISVEKGHNRDHLLEYLTNLLLECEAHLVIRDKYIHSKQNFSRFFKLFPKKKNKYLSL